MFADAPPPPLIEFCVTNEAEAPIHGAWIDIAPHRRQGVQRRSVESGATACGVLAAPDGRPPALRLRLDAGRQTAGAACVLPAPAPGRRRYVFGYFANAEIGERCDLLATMEIEAP